jgi:farnesyl-diphosphate farnesyltransferase
VRNGPPGRAFTGALLRQVSRSFYLSVAVLPAAVRPPIGVAYLLARATDTIADARGLPPAERARRLALVSAELASPEPGPPGALTAGLDASGALPGERTLLARLPECLAAYRALPPADREAVRRVLATIVEGQTLDLTLFSGEDPAEPRALPTRDDLARYTYLVAGCVGEFWTDVHMAHRPRLAHWDRAAMRGLGVRFGQALQMTNILRDLPRDLRLGRCYLPCEDLARLGLGPRDLLDPRALPAVRPLLVDLTRWTLEHYEAGWRYTLAIPAAEVQMRLACTWPLLIGLGTLALLARSPGWLDPALRLHIPRRRVYGLMASSAATVWSTRALGRQARRLRERVPV